MTRTAEERLKERIAVEGSISVADYMAEANAHYYATRDPFGAAGDFTTAPEISQMFGELVGAWLADLWLRASSPAGARYVELGPGRGTLAADALRVMGRAGLKPPVELFETSPVLRRAQADRLPDARWHDSLATLPGDGPLLVVANEFFDALPVRQFAADGRELRVRLQDGRFARDGAAAFESSPASIELLGELASRLARQGGAALIVDYGYSDARHADTLQSVSRHAYADPFETPGERDLTAHVDFLALRVAATKAGAAAFGPEGQGEWLLRLGIAARAEALARASPEKGSEIMAACDRLILPEQMGSLFQVLALTAPAWPEPAGF